MTLTSTGSSLSQARDSSLDTPLDHTLSASLSPDQARRARYRTRFRHARHHDLVHQKEHKVRNADTEGEPQKGASFVTHVVQTVSLVQVVDTDGHPLETQTLYATPATLLIDPDTGATVAIPKTEASATNAVPGPNPASSVDGSLAPTSRFPGSTASRSSQHLSPSTMTQSPHRSGTTPHTSSGTPPASTVPSHPKLSAAHNATNSLGAGNMTLLGGTFQSSMFSTPASLTSTHRTETVSRTVTSSHNSHSTLSASLATTSQHTSTIWNGDLDPGASPQSTSTGGASGSSGDNGPGLSPQQKGIVGGVVGGVAGAAFFLLLVMLALRYKRKRANRAALGEGSSGPAGLVGDGQSDGGPSMAERIAPPGITAAVASLAGRRKSRTPPETTGERGFYRVSGRKLPSVLQAGGDGYTDPRLSVMSGETDYYRGSQAFDPVSGGSTRLALGTPMRPVSGIPIMRTGPGRTAVPEANPFADPDPHGRTTSRESGDDRGPGSRFQEGL